MERIEEVLLKFANIEFIRQVLNILKEKQLIEIPQDIPEQELYSIINKILKPEIDDKPSKVEAPKVKIITTELKIEDSIKHCENNRIKPTVRNIAQYAGVSIATVSRYKQKKD